MDPENPKEMPPLLKKFYKGEPLALGVTQVLTGLIGIAFGAVLNLAYDHKFRFFYIIALAPHWTGALLKGVVSMNVLSAVAASVGILLVSLSLLSDRRYAVQRCSNYGQRELDPQCYEAQVIPHDVTVGIMSVLLLFTLLAFCISISNAFFGSKLLCQDTSSKMIVVVYQHTPLHNGSLPAASEEGKLP
ncbi:hypothetical protein lerEdw1_013475 [Lerista edwardsae]|nr:hypothetical protein lerEdw1_013481 [Lerista edwardsae]KAJ6650246.1 hypothetical protein lerEdw1_013475 [Lerista edwardsae]